MSSDPDMISTLRNAVILLHTTATNVIQMSSTNRFSLAYLSIWVDLAKLQDESAEDEYLARDVFKQLKYNRIGITLPEFWNAYADFEERHGDADKAAKLRAKGASCATKSISVDPVPSSLPRQPRARYGLDNTPQMEKENKQSPDIKPASHPRVRPFYKGTIPPRAARVPLSKDSSPEMNRGALVPETPEQPELFSPGISSSALRAMNSIPGSRLPRKAEDSAQRYLQAQLHPLESSQVPMSRSHITRASPSPMTFASTRSGDRVGMTSRSGQAHRDGNIPVRSTSGYSMSGDLRKPTASDSHVRGRMGRVDSVSRDEVPSLSGRTPSPGQRYTDSRPQKRMASNLRDNSRMNMEQVTLLSSSQRNGHLLNSTPVAASSPGLSGSRRTDSPGDMVSSRDQRYEDGSATGSNVPPIFREIRCLETATVNGTQYLLLGMIGKGGSSRVFRVMTPSRTILALKRVQVRRSCPNFKSTFESYANEIDLLQRLRGSPRIVYCHDAEVREDLGIIYLVMEYGDIDLAKHLTESAKMSPNPIDGNSRRVYWKQMLEAVRTIHEAKIVHGDLKPANFLIVGGTLKLIDFGIAKAIPSEDTTKIFRDAQVGTPNYMSPEALISYDGEDESSGEMRDVSVGGLGGSRPKYRIGRASDIWSLGCILYQMEYGKTPFAHLTNIMKKLSCIQDENYEIQYPPLTDIAVLPVLKGCLQRDPNERMSIPELLSHPFLLRSEQYEGTEAVEKRRSRIRSKRLAERMAEEGLEIRIRAGEFTIEQCDMALGQSPVVTDEFVERLARLMEEKSLRSEHRHVGNYSRQGGLTPTTSGVTNGTRTGGHSFSYGSASMMRSTGLRSGERQRQ